MNRNPKKSEKYHSVKDFSERANGCWCRYKKEFYFISTHPDNFLIKLTRFEPEGSVINLDKIHADDEDLEIRGFKIGFIQQDKNLFLSIRSCRKTFFYGLNPTIIDWSKWNGAELEPAMSVSIFSKMFQDMLENKYLPFDEWINNPKDTSFAISKDFAIASNTETKEFVLLNGMNTIGRFDLQHKRFFIDSMHNASLVERNLRKFVGEKYV